MSANDPITRQLRNYATAAWNPWPEARDRLYQMCDAIDSIHANLERENAALKAELDRVLGEQEDRRSCIYYDPERHYCSCHDIDTNGWVELPKDADGKPIHFGDVMQMDGDSELCDVVGFYNLGFLAWRNGRYVPCAASLYRHATPDTWERIIEDALSAKWSSRGEQSADFDALVARCKALCERTKGGDAE